MESKKDEQVPKGAKIISRQLRGNVLLCVERTTLPDGKKTTTHFLFFPKRNAHMWVTLEKMEEIVKGFKELVKYKSKQDEKE